jgi:hypothetical protein
MATDFSTTGAFNVNGQFATNVKYEASTEQGKLVELNVRFTNGRSEVASARMTPDEAKDVLGDKNFAVIAKAAEKAVARGDKKDAQPEVAGDAPAKDAATQQIAVKGELRGKSLEYRQVVLADFQAASTENAIYADSRVRSSSASGPGAENVVIDPATREALARRRARDIEEAARSMGIDRNASEGQRLNTRDAVVGAAHVAQATGVGGAGIQTAAHVVGAADAAKVGLDLAQGKDVRPLDAATAAASVAIGAGAGGPAVQGAARVTQAFGAVDTAGRAMNSADDAAAKLMGGERPKQVVIDDVDEQARLRRLRAAAVPDGVADRFLKIEDKFYFSDKTLAFVDKGTKLKSESNNVEVVRSLVAIAEARDWQALSVTGTKDFRREVWREASIRGIDVRGYEPSELERAELRKAIEKRYGPNEVSREAPARDVHMPPTPQAPSAMAPSAQQPGQPVAPERVQSPAQDQPKDALRAGVTVGVLVEHGAAPYKFNDKNDDSYYVKVKTERGEQVRWGVDLERAVAESKTKVQVGDVIGVENLGNRPVTVKVRKQGANGQEVVEEIETHRNAWSVEKKEFFQQQSAKADALRNGDREPRQELVKKHPDLTDAAVNLWLSEQVAKKKIDLPQDQERFVAMVKERLAQAVERGETISAPKLRKEVTQMVQAEKAQQRELGEDRGAEAPSPRSSRAAPSRTREAEVPQHVR